MTFGPVDVAADPGLGVEEGARVGGSMLGSGGGSGLVDAPPHATTSEASARIGINARSVLRGGVAEGIRITYRSKRIVARTCRKKARSPASFSRGPRTTTS
jgi:hypothetical protein